jgi:hypothetical protein
MRPTQASSIWSARHVSRIGWDCLCGVYEARGGPPVTDLQLAQHLDCNQLKPIQEAYACLHMPQVEGV